MLIHANRDELLRLSKQVALAVPKTTEIIDLRGIHMEADARRSMLTLTATNQEIAIQASMGAVVEQSGSMVMDARLLPSILALLPEETLDMELGDGDIYEMGLAGKSIVFWSGTLLFSARLMAGKYPDTKMLLEKFQSKYSVSLAAEELVSAINAVSPVMETEGIRIGISFGEHEIHISAETKQGTASAPVKALVLNGADRPFYYNYKILLKYLRLVSGSVTLDFDANGLLAVRAGATQYIQSPLRPPKEAAAQSQQAA